MMVDKIENRFNITELDKEQFRMKMIEMQEKAFDLDSYPKRDENVR